MCGIIGVFRKEQPLRLAKEGLRVLRKRGRDGYGIYSGGRLGYSRSLGELKADTAADFCICHCLHSVVGKVSQPLAGEGVLAANCEIYNWKELADANFKGQKKNFRNDAELLLALFDRIGFMASLKLIDGVYAVAYLHGKRLYLARDIIGEKPLWFSHADGFAFASEKKALEAMGFQHCIELNPRMALCYDTATGRLESAERQFLRIAPAIRSGKKQIMKKLGSLLEGAVAKRIPDRKFGLLFSGGVDSGYLAMMLKRLGRSFTCYTAVLDEPSLKEPEDLRHSVMLADRLGLRLRIIRIRLTEVEPILGRLVPLIEDSGVVKAGVGLVFYAACTKARADGCKVLFSGLGSEEIFAGYQRHKDSADVNRECLSGLLRLYERDLYRDDVISMAHSLEMRLPFLDRQLVEFALRIPHRLKISGGMDKLIFRETAEAAGLPKETAFRKKRAAQYGSNFHKAIEKLSRKKGYRLKSDYLRQFYPGHNLRLGALVSSGKDSLYAMHVMMRQNYQIGCMITVKSRNPDSYMFHTPAVDMASLQAKSIGIPILVWETAGEKERELDDLKAALSEAVKRHSIQGIATGALFSQYQRERIERVADSLGLKVFAPLWHMNQETEMRQLLSEGFSFMLTRIAAEGLDRTWLGRPITTKDIDRLVELNKRIGINIAFEGGEAESLMLDGPIFSRRLEVMESEIIEENSSTAELRIKKAVLSSKLASNTDTL